MGSKNKPGDFDCYEKAHPDEPMFVLLGRDPLAAHVVRHWAALRGKEDPKKAEALACADAMEDWAKHREREHREGRVLPEGCRVVEIDRGVLSICTPAGTYKVPVARDTPY